MAQFLANENIPREALAAAHIAGIEIASIREDAPGADDEEVLKRAQRDQRVVVAFDKDFGELAFRRGRNATQGVILLRPHMKSPNYLAAFLVNVLKQPIDWEGRFSVASEGQIRVVRLPEIP